MAIWPNQTTKRLRKTTKNPLNTLWKTNENDPLLLSRRFSTCCEDVENEPLLPIL